MTNRANSGLLRELVDLARAWWQRDRIRVRPSEGRWFRLRPGTALCFSVSPRAPRTSLEVLERTELQDPRRPGVCYFCRAGSGEGELVVTRGGDGEPMIEWRVAGRSFELHADDIEVF